MVLLYIPQLRDEKSLLVAVWKKGSVAANAAASIISLTMPLAGISIVTVFTLDTTYTLIASDSQNDLPVFPFLSPTFRHDSHGFLYSWFSMKQILPKAVVKKLLLDSAHDAMPYYDCCKKNDITLFMDLNWKCGKLPVYRDDISISNDGIPYA